MQPWVCVRFCIWILVLGLVEPGFLSQAPALGQGRGLGL